MENGGTDLAYKFSGLDVNGSNDNSNDGLFQVMKAVEAAEATIKQQVEENDRLRSELLKKNQELEKYKVDHLKARSSHYRAHGPPGAHQSVSDLANQTDGDSSLYNSSTHDPSRTLGLQEEVTRNVEDPKIQIHGESRSESSKINGTLKEYPGGQRASNNVGFSKFSSPSTASFSPGRNQMEGEYDPQFSLSSHGLMPMADANNPGNPLKQDLVVRAREHENEILQLRKHLAEYSIKEEQIRNEKYVLEKRIADMRMAFDQQQQELIDAASKAIAYRQDIIEENIRISYALQEAQQERSIFVSSLIPILAEYSFQQPDVDAQSIVSNLKVLFKHLQEKLIITEAKLKESQYQMASWRSDMNLTKFAQSPSHSLGKNGLDLVPRPIYSNEKLPISSDPIESRDWDILGHHQSGLGGGIAKHLETDNLRRYSPLANRNTASQGIPVQDAVSQGDSHSHNGETTSKQVTFSDTVSSIEMDEPEMEGHQIGRDPSANWGSPYLPPVPEEPSSSFSEAADDDPLPAVEGLQISGEAFPGRELQASGYSINGTTSCNFEWVRHLEDGSVNYIDGAKQPNYLVSADDIDTYLAIEVQPMDDRKRKGELVTVFANERRKITCDPEMHTHIKKTLQNGHASYRITQSVGYLDLWEPATLAIKREGFSIRSIGTSTGLVTEKFSPATIVTVPCGNPTEFSIIGSGGVEHVLQVENSSEDSTRSRDAIVLTLRLFIRRSVTRCHNVANLLDNKIEEIGPQYVVQVVTDNASNCKVAGHILMERRPTLFWTPCAAHCLDLMLVDIGKLKQFQPTITNARRITTFIYRHGRLLDAMREKTNGRDLVKPVVIRFATAFLTLQSLYKHRDALRHLFISEDWTKSKLSGTEAGKKVCDTIISTIFWHHVEDCIRASQTLLIVLRIVDGDEKPAMPEVFAAMECAKKKIKDAFDNKQRLYKKVIEIVERRCESQMEQKLYGAAFLNPGKYFDIKEERRVFAGTLREDFNDILAKMVPELDLLDKISNLADNYDASRDTFAREIVIRQRKSKNPLDWWNAFGGRAIELSSFAKRILGLCCSSSGCERNWSTFEFAGEKKKGKKKLFFNK